MENVNNFENFLNENFDSAYNIKTLKGIKFLLPPWNAVDKMFKDGDEFQIAFNDKVDNEKIWKDIEKAQKEQKSVKAMDIGWMSDEYHDAIISVKDGNYPGLTYLFKALDKHYGKFGAAMGWR
jgi:hypothetical protein